MSRCVALVCLVALLVTSAPRADEPREAPNFSLLDLTGKYHELRRTDARGVVLFFTGVNCPIARQNAPKIQRLSDGYSAKGVTFWMIDATPQNDPGERTLDVLFNLGKTTPRAILGDRYPIKGMRDLVGREVLGDPETLRRETLETLFGPAPLPPILRDEHQLVSRAYGVTRTAEVVAIDNKTGEIFYRGPVDDQFSEGARRPQARQRYLIDALDAFLAGKPVATPKERPHGCAITFEDDDVRGDISYAKQIAPLLQRKCIACHSPGNIGPFAMSGYARVKSSSAMIQEMLLEKRMPPWGADPHYGTFVNDRSLTGPEARMLLRWIEQGCPRGEGDDPLATTPPPTTSKWPLGEPDFTVSIPKQQIPATGVVDYRYLDGDFEMPRDAWLRAAVVVPGSPKSVHHVIVRVRYPDRYNAAPTEAYLFTSWVPGIEPREAPKGTGIFLPKGARFNFEIHYTTDGQPHEDRTQLGLYLAKETPKMRLEVRATDLREIDIPPNAADARHEIGYCFKRDAMLYELSPHMHLRGSWFRFDLLTPDGRRETLLSVPHYDFNWQNGYRLAEPRKINAGSWVLCTGGFDNSPQNPNNPDPTKHVEWGPQSWNEMFMGFMTVADVPVEK
jgi:hypothetical protein